MLTLCRHMGWEHSAYQRPDHPAQVLIRQSVAAYAEIAPEAIIIGVDGCGVPVFAMPLINMAVAYHNLANPDKLPPKRQEAARRITTAMGAYPQMIAGDGHFCTELIRATKGRIIGKLGADGVYCAAVINGDIAIALKIEDGNAAMLPPAMMRVFDQLKLLDKTEAAQLARFAVLDNINCQNDKVGETSAVFDLAWE
jgi:L-asparaginase II